MVSKKSTNLKIKLELLSSPFILSAAFIQLYPQNRAKTKKNNLIISIDHELNPSIIVEIAELVMLKLMKLIIRVMRRIEWWMKREGRGGKMAVVILGKQMSKKEEGGEERNSHVISTWSINEMGKDEDRLDEDGSYMHRERKE